MEKYEPHLSIQTSFAEQNKPKEKTTTKNLFLKTEELEDFLFF